MRRILIMLLIMGTVMCSHASAETYTFVSTFFPQLSEENENGELSGLAVELIQELFHNMGHGVIIKLYPRKRALQVVLDGEGGGNPRFGRGDSDANGGPPNITDGIFVLNFLFLGGPTPVCMDAADADDNGNVNITDGIFILNFLFLGGPAPPAPAAPTCGEDTTASALTCESFPPCE